MVVLNRYIFSKHYLGIYIETEESHHRCIPSRCICIEYMDQSLWGAYAGAGGFPGSEKTSDYLTILPHHLAGSKLL